MRGRKFLVTLLLITITVLLGGLTASGFAQAPEPILADSRLAASGRPTKQIIVKFSSKKSDLAMLAGAGEVVLAELSQAAGQELTYVRPMSGGAFVLALDEYQSPKEAAVISARLTELPDVSYAEPDLIKDIDRSALYSPGAIDLDPNDTRFDDQWHYRYTPGASEGLNLPAAWGLSTGSSATVVAVIDTGIVNHADLAGKTVPGYDFISNLSVANDGNGRDGDPSDPGDWVAANECGFHPAQDSSWHGTHVAGTIGATSNNGTGVAGVNWLAKILPVRVLGKCGGSTSDIVDAIRWSAGLSVPGVPDNANPADVINLSLGGQGACAISEQQAFDAAVAAGATVVIAAGNDNDNAAGYSPANCNNTITVAATDRGGDRAYYSNFGSIVEVSAPGGETPGDERNGILSTLNTGTASPVGDTYAYYQGTSMATPHVAGLASLVLGLDPALTQAQVLAILQNNARAFPTGSGCSTSNCGAGIVDAYASLLAVEKPAYDETTYLPLLMKPEELPAAFFSSTTYSAGEGSGNASLTIQLGKAVDHAVKVGYRTVDGSATAGNDYVYKNALVTFTAGQVSKTITVAILDDFVQEADESFEVVLYNPQGVTIVPPSQATVTIQDDETPSTGIGNGNFEAGRSVWTEYSSNDYVLILERADLPSINPPHGGDWATWLGWGHDEIGFIEQTVQIPVSTPHLSYWHWIDSEDVCSYDLAGVVINGTMVADVFDLCTSTNTYGWVRRSADLSTWAGQTVAVQFRIETDGSLRSNLYLDDVAFSAAPAPAPEAVENGPRPAAPSGNGTITSRPRE